MTYWGDKWRRSEAASAWRKEGGGCCSTDNELPELEEIASAAAVRNFCCQSLETLHRQADRTETSNYQHSIRVNLFIFARVRWSIGWGWGRGNQLNIYCMRRVTYIVRWRLRDMSVWQHHGLCSLMDKHRQKILYYITEHMKTFIKSAFSMFRAHMHILLIIIWGLEYICSICLWWQIQIRQLLPNHIIFITLVIKETDLCVLNVKCWFFFFFRTFQKVQVVSLITIFPQSPNECYPQHRW